MADTISVDWKISTEGKEEVGNGANRFDTQRQSQTLGPYPPPAPSGPPETGGDTPHEGS